MRATKKRLNNASHPSPLSTPYFESTQMLHVVRDSRVNLRCQATFTLIKFSKRLMLMRLAVGEVTLEIQAAAELNVPSFICG